MIRSLRSSKLTTSLMARATIAAMFLLGTSLAHAWMQPPDASAPTPQVVAGRIEKPTESAKLPPKSLAELLKLTPSELERIDIGLMNLLCTERLPGSEKVEIPAALAELDRWAARVKSETERYLHQYHRNPAEFDNSESQFRIITMITVLQLDLGVKYNLKKLQSPDFKDSRDLFIHGLLGYGDGGTCVSMPALYAAVAHRLGYPVKLVFTKEHVFCRWDGHGERFNIEATSPGFVTHDDDYYRKWPRPISDKELAEGVFLKSLTAAEALSDFLTSRGHCLYDNGRLKEARDAYVAAARLMPQHPGYKRNVRAITLELSGAKIEIPNPPPPESL